MNASVDKQKPLAFQDEASDGPAEQPLAGRREWIRALLMALAGSLIIGVIALVANWGHPPFSIAVAVAGQMGLCFAMTLTSATMMQVAFRIPRRPLFKFLAASAGIGGFSLALMTLVHWLIGTPEVFKTVASASAVSFFYYLLFPLALLKEHQSATREAYRSDPHWRREWGLKRFPVPYGLADFLRVVWHNLAPPARKHQSLTPFLPGEFHLGGESHHPVRVIFLGDLMPMLSRSLSVDDALRQRIGAADYLVANFEGSLGSGPWACLQQQHSESVLDILSSLLPPERIFLSVANNHAADFDYWQFEFTNKVLREKGFQVFGSREQPSVLIDGWLNLVGATEWTNQPHGYLSFLEHAERHLRPDGFNLLYPHWGYEMECYPRPDWIQRAKSLIESFDAIVGHHSHLPGPVTTYEDSQGRNKLVAYSLGDATTGLKLGRYQHGMVLDLDICRTTHQVTAGRWQFVRTHIRGHEARVELHARCPLFPGLNWAVEQGLGVSPPMPDRLASNAPAKSAAQWSSK
ncbi:CapA family protein [Alcanivorax sediminis]|uniref:Capsule synthesis protein CapA domain-containing protein n=1 Tax=Alcanivorax sediminis TaxID=2663008 RepID=A0A6N7LSM9_9GAMM|nr:CapA family protein [Alcanivorax sediminis]MQX53429.1 hypothetical protein [Alcanivorax sediminis]